MERTLGNVKTLSVSWLESQFPTIQANCHGRQHNSRPWDVLQFIQLKWDAQISA